MARASERVLSTQTRRLASQPRFPAMSTLRRFAADLVIAVLCAGSDRAPPWFWSMTSIRWQINDGAS
jgi:hypothetical protein